MQTWKHFRSGYEVFLPINDVVPCYDLLNKLMCLFCVQNLSGILGRPFDDLQYNPIGFPNTNKIAPFTCHDEWQQVRYTKEGITLLLYLQESFPYGS